MFDKLLIANRGEIACRIIRTARRMGIKTVAVFSDADAQSLHVRQADEAYLIGPAAVAESYLRGDKILEVAKHSGAQAIHPGYGFLSENASFARACAETGITFIGPSPDSIEVMGSKALSKDLMKKAGVPLSPGYQGQDQSLERFKTEASKIGYPVLLKATAGGGGKGMRIVEAESEIEEALRSAQREAKSSFGDDRFLVEKFIPGPRHVEVQVFGDTHGNVVHLFERDCSVQRRYQKVVEEAPAPNLSNAIRHKLLHAGIEAARAVNYVGAGTVEFLYDGGENVYFMEMNTRLQVEHPVTEEVTGLDLVEWQLRVAAGEPLPLEQDQIYCDGHAVEVRLYAEDPANEYRPSIGDVDVFEATLGDGIRVDTGIESGSAVTPFYDPMIAKVIAHGDSRQIALSRLAGAVGGIEVSPLKTNQGFLRRILTHPEFITGGVTTKFLSDHQNLGDDPVPPPKVLALTALGIALTGTEDMTTLSADVGPWRMNLPRTVQQMLVTAGQTIPVSLAGTGHRWEGKVGDNAITLDYLDKSALPDVISALHDGVRVVINANFGEPTLPLRVFTAGNSFMVSVIDPGAIAVSGGADTASLMAPMPSTVTSVSIETGASVTAGQTLMTLEAMKMEHPIKAPSDGVITDIFFAPGDTVGEGVKLLGFVTA